MKHVARKLTALLQAWYQVDRVRIAPSDGRLLQLDVGDRFVLHDEIFVVERRKLKSSEAICEVDLLLQSEGATAVLHVQRLHPAEPVRAYLTVNGQSQEVLDGDVMRLSAETRDPAGGDQMSTPDPRGPSVHAAGSFPSVDSPLPAFRVS